MKKIEFGDNTIVITAQKKKLFGGVSEKIVTISLEDVESASKEIFGTELNSSTIILKNGQEEFIVANEVEGQPNLNEMLEWLKSKKEEFGYKMEMLNIETMEQQEI